jgi:hypothetical protein
MTVNEKINLGKMLGTSAMKRVFFYKASLFTHGKKPKKV